MWSFYVKRRERNYKSAGEYDPSRSAFQGGHSVAGWYLPGGTGGHPGHVLVTEFRGMALNGLLCADVLWPLDLVPLTDFTYKYYPAQWEPTWDRLPVTPY